MAEEKKIKIVFMGTPGFARVSLQALLDWEGCEIVAVYTQPDRPCGRGQTCKPSETKELALEKGIPVYQPVNFKAEDDLSFLESLQADVLCVAAYGLILPQRVLDAARLGAVNVHASLLPRYRGAAPIHRSIVSGEHVTGITIMQMEKGLDSGPVLLQRSLAIGLDDTAETLHDQLADLGGRLLVQVLEKMAVGPMRTLVQDHDLASYAPKLEKKEGLVNWNRPALEVHNQIRGLFPWPGCWFEFELTEGRSKGKKMRVTVFPGQIGEELKKEMEPGEIVGLKDDCLAIACRDREYLIPKLKPACGKPMDGKSFFCGYLSQCQE